MITSLLAMQSFEAWQIVLLAFGYAATLAAIIGVGVLLVRSGQKSSSNKKVRKVVVQPTQQQARPANPATPIVVQLPQQVNGQKSAQQPVAQQVPIMVQPQQPTVITQMPYVQPMMQMPYVQPMMQMPMAQPMVMPYYMPMQQPMMQQPIMQQPVMQQPVQQQSVAQQPAAQQPVQAQSVPQQPAPEPEVRRGMADNDRVLDVFGFYSPVDDSVSSTRSRETSKRRG